MDISLETPKDTICITRLFISLSHTHTHTHKPKAKIKMQLDYHRIPLVRWSLHKYKCLWGVGGKGRGLSIQEGVSHTYKHRLG